MSTATSSLQFLLARAAVRSDALMHIVSRRDTGLLNPICAAHPIRSQKIDEWTTAPADLTALCTDCAAIAGGIKGVSSIEVGIAVFLGADSTGAPVALLTEVPITMIDLPAAHARRSPDDIDDLAASVTERGVVTPVTLRRAGARFEVIDGARRVAAAHIAGHTTVPALVRDTTERDALIHGLLANMHRTDLNPIDQAHAYVHAIEALNCNSKAELGRLLGISREKVSNTIRLLDLPEEEQARIAAGDLTAEGGRKLLAAPRSAPERLTDVADLLAQLLTAKVKVTASGGRTRIVIDVADADADRILGQLGETAVTA
ncbi:MAG: ParB/RepB/Spo0J family partition protein [Acidobacteria bacterium]|nr:ParB/RepB/Spo0J family partition protein [Acidobacteriota bacterium]